jgi:hypothetical protein
MLMAAAALGQSAELVVSPPSDEVGSAVSFIYFGQHRRFDEDMNSSQCWKR